MTVDPRFDVRWREPFSRAVFWEIRDAGQTIAEIVASVPGLPDDFAEVGSVLIGEHVIPRAIWHRVRPRGGVAAPVTVSLYYPIRGGKGGGGAKQVLGAVASIGLLLATSGIAAGGLATAGGLFAAGSTSAKVLAAGVGVVGSLALSALTPPPAQPKQPDERKQRFAGLGGNALEPGGIVPSVIGTMRVEPPAACRPLIELVGDDRETAEVVLFMDGPLEWSDIRVDDVSTDRIEELSVQTREGKPGDTATTNVERYSRQENPSLTLTGFDVDEEDGKLLSKQSDPGSVSPIWHAFRTRRSPDEFWLNLLCPQGIYDQSGGAAPTKPVVMPIRVRFREVGAGSWVNCPELHILSRQGDPSKYCIKLVWEAPPSLIAPPEDRGFVQCFAEVGSAWSANSYFLGAGDEWLDPTNWNTSTGVRRLTLERHQAIFYLNPATFPKGTYEVEIKKGSIERISGGDPGTLSNNADYASGGYPAVGGAGSDLFTYYTDTGDHYAPRDQLDLYQTVGVERIASVWNTHPITTPGEWAVISLKVKGRTLGTVSAIAKGIVDDLDGGDWDNPVTTSNPAPWMRDILRGARNPKPLGTALIDDDGLEDWRTRCANRGYTVDLEVKGQTVGEVARIVASCGYAQTYWNEKWGVVEDKDRSGETITSLFSPRDIADWNVEKNTDELPDHYIVRFLNKDDDYRPDEVVVYAAGNTEETEDLPEVIELVGIVEEEKAVARVEFDDAVIRSRMSRYSFKTGRKALSKRRGDLIAVGHDSFDHAIGFARIIRVIYDSDGEDIIAAVLDAEIPMDVDTPASAFTPVSSGDDLDLPPSATSSTEVDEETLLIDEKYMRCTIELRNGDVFEREFMLSGRDLIEFDTPIPDVAPSAQDPEPWVGAHVTTGTVQRGDHRRMIVMSVLPEEGRFAATITAVDEAPDLPFPDFS